MESQTDDKARARAARLEAEATAQRSAKRRTAILRLGLVLALAAVVVVVAVVLSSGGSKSTPAGGSGASSAASGDAADVAALFDGIPQKGVTLGDPAAKATLIEFADLQCPFCAEYSNQAMSTVVTKYVKPGKLRYELRLRSFLGKDSVTAAGAAAAAAGENRLFQFADLFYKRQGQENSGYVTDAFIRSVATAAGVDPAAALAAAKSPGGQPLVSAAEQKANSLGSNSTPAFYLRLASGRIVPVTPQDLTADAVSAAIDQALTQT
jgi:protein-disulfide isomerase